MLPRANVLIEFHHFMKKSRHSLGLNNSNYFIILFNTRALVRVEEQSIEEEELKVATTFLSFVTVIKLIFTLKVLKKNANIMEKQGK